MPKTRRSVIDIRRRTARSLVITLLTILPMAVMPLGTRAYAQETGNLDPAAAHLVGFYGMDTATAEARIELQPVLIEASKKLQEAYPETFGGAYIDRNRDGTPHFLFTSLDTRVTESIRSMLPQGTRFEVDPVAHSLQHLEQVQNTIRTGLALEDGVATAVDIWSNSVEVFLNRSSNYLDTARSEIASDYGSAVTTRLYDGPLEDPRRAQLACSYPSPTVLMGCSDPIRGGVGITRAGAACSAGFNVASNSDNLRYLITTAHCFAAPGTAWSAIWSDGISTYAVGPQHGNGVYTSSQDAGIIRESSSIAAGPNRVFVASSSSPSYPTTRNESYTISATPGTSGPLVGHYVCASGTTGGTSCGYVKSVGYQSPLTGNTGFARVIQDTVGGVSQGAACHGDSGGPVYVAHVGYGLVAETNTTTVAYTRNGTDCFGDWLYRGLSGALNATNVHLVSP